MALSGASLTVRSGDRAIAATSSDADGSYVVLLAPGTYSLRAELSAFATVDRDVVLGGPPCTSRSDIEMTLASRIPGAVAAVAPAEALPAGTPGPRFQSLSVRQSAAAPEIETALVTQAALGMSDDPAARLLPPGFSPDAVLESVAVSGSLIQLDRGQLNAREQALGRGEFGLGEGQTFGAPLAAGDDGLFGPGGGAAGGRGGRGGLGGFGRGGGGRVQVNATYSIGGSMFDSAPYALREQPATERDYLQQSFSTTIGGPVRVPGVYDGTNRTTFNFSYSGGRNNDFFDQYATVPGEAMRAGDFSASPVAILDPLTGQPFPGNQIPTSRMSAAALALLRYLPDPNLSGDTRNYHLSDTTASTSDTFTLRLTHAITQPQAGRGGRGGGGRAGGAGVAGTAPGAVSPAAQGRGGPGGRGGFQPPLNATANATVNYRRNDGDRANVFPLLAGATRGTTVSVPVTLNVRSGRNVHVINTSVSRTTSSTLNGFAFTEDVAGLAGITGVATDPFDWGVPSLTFGTFTALRDTAPSRRNDSSWQIGYGLTRPAGTHTFRLGGSYQQQLNRTQSDSNARGTFTFTGLYTAGGQTTVRGSGQDFADFLLGLPQQATRQYNGAVDSISAPVTIRGRQISAYFQDDWRLRARWTLNYGIRYDFLAPYTETSGHMVNLDASPDFSAVAPVTAGDVGPYTGGFPAGLVEADWNNVAPRVGAAWRATNRSVVRFGYGLTYNTGSYASIARNLYQQPPFFETGTSTGTIDAPLILTDPFANIAPSTITNSYGIERDYQLGLIHQWNVDYSRDVFRGWNVGTTYIGTRGAQLDVLRAPNRGPDGPRLPDVQSFTWQSAEGSSHMNGISFRAQKRQANGVSGSASYTLSRSWDNTTATGGGATVAQDDRDLEAEWALSNFDRRHQLSGNLNIDLPWGRNRRWLANGGALAALAGDWSVAATVTVQSGTPLTARCSTCASDVARGVGGTLRANYDAQPVGIADRTIDQFFNTSAFSIPEAGTFGNSPRNLIVGPGSRQVNAQFNRDVSLGGNRGVSVGIVASNLLNLVNYGTVDTNVNSPTFGQVLSVRGRRTVRLNLRFRF